MRKFLGRLRPHWRIMSWIVLLFNMIMLIWIISAGASGSGCHEHAQDMQQACQAGADVGKGIAIYVLLTLWAMGDVILGIIWLVTRPSRHCPACGRGVRKGKFECKRCGFDFRPVAIHRAEE